VKRIQIRPSLCLHTANFFINYFIAFLACCLCVSHISHKSVGDGGGHVADTSASWAVITTAFGSLYKNWSSQRIWGNVHKIYWVMMKENCRLDHQMVLSNFKTHFTVSQQQQTNWTAAGNAAA